VVQGLVSSTGLQRFVRQPRQPTFAMSPNGTSVIPVPPCSARVMGRAFCSVRVAHEVREIGSSGAAGREISIRARRNVELGSVAFRGQHDEPEVGPEPLSDLPTLRIGRLVTFGANLVLLSSAFDMLPG
jgi:hypothetical protein